MTNGTSTDVISTGSGANKTRQKYIDLQPYGYDKHKHVNSNKVHTLPPTKISTIAAKQ